MFNAASWWWKETISIHGDFSNFIQQGTASLLHNTWQATYHLLLFDDLTQPNDFPVHTCRGTTGSLLSPDDDVIIVSALQWPLVVAINRTPGRFWCPYRTEKNPPWLRSLWNWQVIKICIFLQNFLKYAIFLKL